MSLRTNSFHNLSFTDLVAPQPAALARLRHCLRPVARFLAKIGLNKGMSKESLTLVARAEVLKGDLSQLQNDKDA